MQNQDLAIWCAEAHRLAIGKGFWGKNPDAVIDEPNILAAKIALMHSELSELLEAIRENPDAPCGKNVNLTREEEEVADAYKDVADVVSAVEEAGLSKVVARLRPIAVVKG